MTPALLYSGARKAVKLALEYEREADAFDADWKAAYLSEAKRCRERAAYYLKQRASVLQFIQEQASKREAA